MDIDYLIDRLEALLQTGKRVPLSNKVMVDEQECYALIDQMRATVPAEIKNARQVLTTRERLIDEAEENAQQIIEQANQERQMMLEREGLLAEADRQSSLILSEATSQAFEIRNHAQSLYDEGVSQAQTMREGANQYAMQVLQEIEILLDKHLNVVRNGLQNFIKQSQDYQQQLDDYQRQYRPQYAPTKAEVAAANKAAAATPARPEPAPARPVATRVGSPAPARKPEGVAIPPAPITSRPSAAGNRSSASSGSNSGRSATPVAPAAASPANLNDKRGIPSRLNVVQPSPGIRPVPKVNPRATNDNLDDDEGEFTSDFDPDDNSNDRNRRGARPPF